MSELDTARRCADTAFAFACKAHYLQTIAASALIELLRPARAVDVLTATAKEDYREHRGRAPEVIHSTLKTKQFCDTLTG